MLLFYIIVNGESHLFDRKRNGLVDLCPNIEDQVRNLIWIASVT